MPQGQDHYTFDRVVRMVLSAATVIAALVLLRYLSDVLLPFAAAVVLAYLLNPLVTVFEQRTKRRGLAVGITISGLGIVCFALVVLLVPLMIGQVSQFQHALEKLHGDLVSSVSVAPVSETLPAQNEDSSTSSPKTKTLEVAKVKSESGLAELKEAWSRYRLDAGEHSRAQRLARLREAVSGTLVGNLIDRAVVYTESEEFSTWLIDAAKNVAVGGWTVVTFAVNLMLGLTGLIIVLLYLVFLLLDFPEYARTWQTFLPPQYRGGIVEFLEQFNTALRRYFRGQSAVALVVGILFTIGFSLIGLPMAIPFGLFVGLLNMVPYLQMVAIVPGLLLAGLNAVEGDSSFAASVGLLLLVFAVVQLIQDGVLTPKLMGKATGLRPVAILLGVFIWGKLLGFMGLILAIPLTCLGIAYYRRYVLRYAAEATKPPVKE